MTAVLLVAWTLGCADPAAPNSVPVTDTAPPEPVPFEYVSSESGWMWV